jgi:hypothetical protein
MKFWTRWRASREWRRIIRETWPTWELFQLALQAEKRSSYVEGFEAGEKHMEWIGGKQCEWIDREPVHIKRIGNFVIDRSEWEDERGAFSHYKETRCKFVADDGHKFCPKHELQSLAESKPEAHA